MKHFLAMALLLAAIAGARAAAPAKPSEFQPLTPDGYLITNSNSPATVASTAPTAPSQDSTNAPADTTTELDDRHKLVAGDKLSFTILEDRFFPNLSENRFVAPTTVADLSKALIVADTGELDVPYVGRIKVAGRTCKDVGAELKVLLEKDYYYKATVVLGLDQMSREQGRVYVSGEVRSPGAVLIPPSGNFTVGKAILGAGGFTEWAKKNKVLIVRNPQPGQPTNAPVIVDMEEILIKGRTDKDLPLQPEDYIIVPKSIIHL